MSNGEAVMMMQPSHDNLVILITELWMAIHSSVYYLLINLLCLLGLYSQWLLTCLCLRYVTRSACFHFQNMFGANGSCWKHSSAFGHSFSCNELHDVWFLFLSKQW